MKILQTIGNKMPLKEAALALGLTATAVGGSALITNGVNEVKNSPQYLRLEAKEMRAKGQNAEAFCKELDAYSIENGYPRFNYKAESAPTVITKECKPFIKNGGILAVDDNIGIALDNVGIATENVIGNTINKTEKSYNDLTENPSKAGVLTAIGLLSAGAAIAGYRRKEEDSE